MNDKLKAQGHLDAVVKELSNSQDEITRNLKGATLRVLRNEGAIADLQMDTCSLNMHTEVK